MEIKLSLTIKSSVDRVFEFLSDFEKHHQENNSRVLLVEKLTPGTPGIGAQYRETVQMLPFLKVGMISEMTKMKPNELIEFTWSGGGMEGVLRYHFVPLENRTNLEFSEKVILKGVMNLVSPLIRASFQETMAGRLNGIKRVLEASKGR